MSEHIRPQYPLYRDQEKLKLEHLGGSASLTHQKQLPEQLAALHYPCPTPSTCHELATSKQGSTARLAPHRLGCSHIFHTQESEFFSRPTLFRPQIIIDIDLPQDTRAKGYSPPRPQPVTKGGTPRKPQKLPLSPPPDGPTPPSQRQYPNGDRRAQPQSQPHQLHHSKATPPNPLPTDEEQASNDHRIHQSRAIQPSAVSIKKGSGEGVAGQ